MSTECYANDLHEALLNENNTAFWKCWQSKFESVNKCIEVDGCEDADVIVEKFHKHFSKSYSFNNMHRAESLKEEYTPHCVKTTAGFLWLRILILIRD